MLDNSKPPTKWKRLGAHFQARFTAGVLIIIPVLVTYIVIGWIVGFIVDTLEPVIEQAEGHLASWMTGVCLLYTSPSPRDGLLSRMPSSA